MSDPKRPEPPSKELPPSAGDLLARALRRLAGRGRQEVEKAAELGRQRLEQRQRKKDLDAFWVRLGKTAWRLVQAGEIDHPALRKAMARIAELEGKIALAEEAAAEAGPGGAEP